MNRRDDTIREPHSDAAWLFGGAMFFVLFFLALALLGIASGSI